MTTNINSVEVRESEIEDIFALYPELLKTTLSLDQEPYLICRQKILPSGRLDLLYSHAKDLILVELKIEPFKKDFIRQTLGYRKDLIDLQSKGKFIVGKIIPYLVCPNVTRLETGFANESGITAVCYSPGEILKEFYKRAPLETKYFSLIPTDKGVWRIGLINQCLYIINKFDNSQEIAAFMNYSQKTVGNQLRLATELGLIQNTDKKLVLTATGEAYISARDSFLPIDVISSKQADIMRRLIIAAPFFSGTTFGILTLATCIFELSKNTYPVPLGLLSRHFINAAGLHFRWDKEKAINKGVRMYSNYAVDLGLVGKMGNSYFVTPSGLSFVLLLNMHKSIKFIESIRTIN